MLHGATDIRLNLCNVVWYAFQGLIVMSQRLCIYPKYENGFMDIQSQNLQHGTSSKDVICVFSAVTHGD